MKFPRFFLISLTAVFLVNCERPGNRGTSICATKLNYVTNRFTSGADAIRNSSQYIASITVGANDYPVNAVLDIASANLVINEKNFDYNDNTLTGKKPYVLDNDRGLGVALHAKDQFDIGCISDVAARFSLAGGNSSPVINYLGLGFSDPSHHSHEKIGLSFFDQLVKEEGLSDIFSLALCGSRGNSHILLGGIHERMRPLMGNFVRLIDKNSYSLPAIELRRADNKRSLGRFPTYDSQLNEGRRTILDSSASFLLLPSEMATAVSKEIEKVANLLNLEPNFPLGFFRTERFNTTKVVRFSNLNQIRQFPELEISFKGLDGKIKYLSISPLQYFKEMDNEDNLIRTFAIRESVGDIALGQPFLESNYVMVDRKNGVVGFANRDIGCAKTLN